MCGRHARHESVKSSRQERRGTAEAIIGRQEGGLFAHRGGHARAEHHDDANVPVRVAKLERAHERAHAVGADEYAGANGLARAVVDTAAVAFALLSLPLALKMGVDDRAVSPSALSS